jgi:hypothetical protein
MKSFESDIKRIAEKTRLKVAEREAIRERILSYMEYHPLKKEHVPVSILGSIRQNDIMYLTWNSLWVRVTSGVLGLMLIVGVPLLAERSVPGDILYLVKTGVNEGIRTQLASSPYEKVELETKLIERRIAEARLLAQEGKLTTEVEAQIAKTVKGHADAVQSGIAELRVQDADGAAIAEIVFTSSLDVQSAVLEVSGESDASSVESILSVVNTVRSDVASDEGAVPSYEGLLARIELETTRTYELFESVKIYATADEVADIERRLADIDRSIVAAKELKQDDETRSVNEMVSVLGHIQKLIAFMTDIDVRETVALETLVPVILTREERTAIVNERLATIATQLRVLDGRMASSTDTSIDEKVSIGRQYTLTLVASTTEALAVDDIESSEALSSEALTMVNDLLVLTDTNIVPVDTTTEGDAGSIESTETDVGTSTTEVIPNVTGTTTDAVSGDNSLEVPTVE